MKRLRKIGTVEVTGTVDMDDVLKAVPGEEEVITLLKAFIQFAPRNVRTAVEIYLEQHPEIVEDHEQATTKETI